MKLIYRNVSSRGRCNTAAYHEQALADFKALVFTRRRDQGRRKDDLDTENCTKGHKASLKSPCNSRRRGAVIVAFSLLHRDA